MGEIIEALKEKSGDLKVKLLLGIALQEAGSDPEALKIFTECAEMGSVSGSARSHLMRPYLKCLYLKNDSLIPICFLLLSLGFGRETALERSLSASGVPIRWPWV